MSANIRRSYRKPQLKLYGDIKILTQAIADAELAPDGAGMNAVPNKTN